MLMLVVVVVAALSMSACLGQDYGGDVTTATPPSNGNGEMSRKRALVPAMFVFGDSLIDNGNNNNLPSFAKANYYPYGIDFNDGPTGRFSNAYTIVDAIGISFSLIQFDPCFLFSCYSNLRTYINFCFF